MIATKLVKWKAGQTTTCEIYCDRCARPVEADPNWLSSTTLTTNKEQCTSCGIAAYYERHRLAGTDSGD